MRILLDIFLTIKFVCWWLKYAGFSCIFLTTNSCTLVVELHRIFLYLVEKNFSLIFNATFSLQLKVVCKWWSLNSITVESTFTINSCMQLLLLLSTNLILLFLIISRFPFNPFIMHRAFSRSKNYMYLHPMWSKIKGL